MLICRYDFDYLPVNLDAMKHSHISTMSTRLPEGAVGVGMGLPIVVFSTICAV